MEEGRPGELWATWCRRAPLSAGIRFRFPSFPPFLSRRLFRRIPVPARNEFHACVYNTGRAIKARDHLSLHRRDARHHFFPTAIYLSGVFISAEIYPAGDVIKSGALFRRPRLVARTTELLPDGAAFFLHDFIGDTRSKKETQRVNQERRDPLNWSSSVRPQRCSSRNFILTTSVEFTGGPCDRRLSRTHSTVYASASLNFSYRSHVGHLLQKLWEFRKNPQSSIVDGKSARRCRGKKKRKEKYERNGVIWRQNLAWNMWSGITYVIRSSVRTCSSARRETQNSYVSGFQSAKSSRRKEARPGWL